MKGEWCKFHGKCKNGSGLVAEKEPSWYKILKPIFSEKNESLHLAEGSDDLLFDLQNYSIDSDFESRLTDDKNSFQKSHEKSLNEEGKRNVIRGTPRETRVKGNKKLVVAPHRKRNVVRSQNQALPKIAKGMEDLARAQTKRKNLMIEADKKKR